MQQNRSVPVWAGRATALVAIALLALNLRAAVAALSPIFSIISGDIPLDSISIGLLGMLPPLVFAAAGFVAPIVARRLGLEGTLAIACSAMVAGTLIRSFAPGFPVLALGSAVALAGMGFGNILMPPVIKKYFPNAIGPITGVYMAGMALGTSLPPLLAAQGAEQFGWRVSSGAWGLLALLAAAPWIVLWLRARGHSRQAAADGIEPEPRADILAKLWRSRVALAITLAMALSAFQTYSLFAWLAEIVIDIGGVQSAQAGFILSLFGIVSLPGGLLVPILAARLRNVGWIMLVTGACLVAGYLGLLGAPSAAPVLFGVLLSAGTLSFPMCIALIALRTRTHEGAIALSGFAQGFGYGIAALGPLLVGIVHDASGGWTAPLVLLLVTSVIPVISAVILRKRRMVEDDLAGTS